MRKSKENRNFSEEQPEELLYLAFVTEIGSIDIYTEAVQCAVNEERQKESKEFEQTKANNCWPPA